MPRSKFLREDQLHSIRNLKRLAYGIWLSERRSNSVDGNAEEMFLFSLVMLLRNEIRGLILDTDHRTVQDGCVVQQQ